MLSRIQIRQFLAVVDTGSFTKAANALNVAQPSLSAGIAELERQLGTRLFVRERRRIRLTQAGNHLLPLARSIERDFHQIQAQVSSLPVPLKPIRLGILETIPSAWLETAIRSYQGAEPLEVTEGLERELQASLASGSLDLALTLVTQVNPGQVAEAILREGYRLAVPVGHVLAHRENVTAAAVAGETMIARRSCEVLADTSRFFTERGVRPRFSLRSANDDRVMAMVRAGLGVTVAPQSLGDEGIAMIRLEEFDRYRVIGFAFGSHWNDEYGTDHALLRAFRDSRPKAESID